MQLRSLVVTLTVLVAVCAASPSVAEHDHGAKERGESKKVGGCPPKDVYPNAHCGPYDIYILGGGKKKADAEEVAKRVNAKVYALRWVEKVGPSRIDPVRVVKSDDVKGLKPGFFVAVAGTCNHGVHDASAREQVLKSLRKLEAGAYLRHIHKDNVGFSCPAYWDASIVPSLEEVKLRSRIDKAEKKGGKKLVVALVGYGTYLQRSGRLMEAEVFATAALKIDPDDKAANNLAKTLTVLLTD